MALEPPVSGWGPLVERALGPLRIDAKRRDWFGRYLDEIVTWNQRMDLTAARSAEELADLVLADAGLIAATSSGGDAADAKGDWIDVGSGAGAPGLPLAVLLDAAQVTLVEPRDKRVAFLRSAIGKFGLPRTKVERGRSDRLPDRGWDTAVSRATLPPPAWLREGTRLARTAVWVLLAREEPPAQRGWSIDADLRYEWPLTGRPAAPCATCPAQTIREGASRRR